MIRAELVDKWAVLEDDLWSDPVAAIKVFEDDLTSSLSVGAKVLNLWLRFQACHGRLSECSKESLADSLAVSAGTISRWLKELKEADLLNQLGVEWLVDSGAGKIYFIQGRDGTPIKIGKAIDPNARLLQLQTAHTEPLRLLAVIESGGLKLERELHRRFSQYRVHGEWFRPDDELLMFIRAL